MLAHSPQIVTNGLVFYYDMGNPQKSWRGAPTNNVSLQNGQNDVNPWLGDGSPTPLGIDPSIRFRGRKVAKFQTGSSGNCYLNGTAKLSPSTTSTVWTSTFYLKRVDGTAISSVGMYQYITNNSNVNQVVSVTQVEDGWYKAVYTRSGLTAGYPTLTGMYSLGTSTQYYFAEWQVEPLSFSTPYVDGTRSNTQAILDLTGNNTITTNSLTYNTNGTFSFNGSSNFVTLPENSNFNSQNHSVEVWIRTNATTQNGFWFEKGNVNTQYSLFQEGTNIQWRHRYTDNVLDSQSTTTANFINTINWAQVIGTYGGGLKRTYINEALVNSKSESRTVSTNANGCSIGVYGGVNGSRGYYYNGDIGIVKVYNRALSASEVAQNFNALRGRYGI